MNSNTGGVGKEIPSDGSLVRQDWGSPLVRLDKSGETQSMSRGEEWRLTVSAEPITVRIEAADGRLIQQIREIKNDPNFPKK